MGAGGDDVRVLLLAVGSVAVCGMVFLVATALLSAARAVRIGGSRLLFNGLAWFVPPGDLPAEARPHMRRAVARWLGAMGCLVLAGLGFGLAGALE